MTKSICQGRLGALLPNRGIVRVAAVIAKVWEAIVLVWPAIVLLGVLIVRNDDIY